MIQAVLLLLALMGSALFLVNTSYESRRLFSAIEREKAQARQLDTDFKRLDAERLAQGTHLRVEKIARERLQMRTASPGVTHTVVDSAAPAASGGRR